MNKEQKCISLELAKELQEAAKEAGLELPESEWWWDVEVPYIVRTEIIKGYNLLKYVRAFDTAELGEILPKGYESWKWLDEKKNVVWSCCLNGNNVNRYKTEAEARGKMLLYLIKNKLIKGRT